ncbi:ROK family transcriptional regulator [Streptomyces sp. NPDC088196]|uniref:ROK family transcriptional regulator n=1 Tax=Streptomyces sp. NPDC088196 TaxID=3154868 RepID=UPI00344FFA2D
MRSHNAALVLDLLRTAGVEGISRLELAERTGLTPQAVSKITARLRDSGLAAEAGRRASTGGKPRTVLRLVPEAGHAVGVHLDRDELRVVLVDLTGAVVGERGAPLDLGAGAGVVVEAVAREVELLVGEVAGGGLGAGAGSEAAGAEGGGAEGGGAEGSGTGAGAAGVGIERRLADSGRSAGSGRVADAAGLVDAGRLADPVGLAGAASLADPVRRANPASAAHAAPAAARLLADAGRSAGSGRVADAAGLADAGCHADAAGLAGAASLADLASDVQLGFGAHLLGVGVALPGPLDHAHGILHRVTGFPEWDGFPLRDALARRLGVPVVVDKDTNAAALGLAVAGEGGSFAYLHLGTGLGAGLVIGGGVHRGARTGAGEFGHQVIQLDGPPCDCGNRGCIEALCLAAVARGDLDESARVLGAGAANLVGLLDIDLVLLGGRTVATDPEPFVRGVAAVLDERARREGAREAAVPVRVAPGGARGVAEGAAQLLLGPLFGRADG